MSERRVEYVELDAVRGADLNPKRHASGHLKASVSRFGFVEPMVMDERTGKLVSGHGRLHDLLSRRARGEPPPDGVADDWRVPVIRGWSSADDAEAAAFLLAANRVGELGGWDDSELLTLLASLDGGSPADLLGTGFDGSDLDDLMESLANDSEPADSPFSEFDRPPAPEGIAFRFGDYAGQVSGEVYRAFVAAYELHRTETGAAMLDDVLRSWLGDRVE